ncbi:hypothetical protein GE061_004112 [Apolygus lucorum]|uniref:Late endosomal/lysosomal adaptor and MAPK and MTOR activator 5 n=1 Tax=Apolygus lucorum TaxID=248454 RepID=A0A8S9WYC5_APOLU|nr:hypothetical protein GE061_004112 [Apolygus lucorum]
MEANLEAELYEIMKTDGVTGAILSDEHGLCLLASPDVKPEMAGILSAIVQHASMIDNRNENPVINFEGDSRQCLIKKEGSVTTAIFKKIS